MSLLTKKSIYGLIAIYELYKHKESQKPTQLRDISTKTGISQSYLEQILSGLKNANIVTSTRGAKGGYRLRDNHEDILIKDIIMVLDGEISCIKDDIQNPMFDLFFRDCDKQIVQIFDKSLSYLEIFEKKITNHIDYSI